MSTSTASRLRLAERVGDPVLLAAERARAGLCRGCGRDHPEPFGRSLPIRGEAKAGFAPNFELGHGLGIFTQRDTRCELGWNYEPGSGEHKLYVVDPCGRIACLQPFPWSDIETEEGRAEARRRHGVLWADSVDVYRAKRLGREEGE